MIDETPKPIWDILRTEILSFTRSIIQRSIFVLKILSLMNLCFIETIQSPRPWKSLSNVIMGPCEAILPWKDSMHRCSTNFDCCLDVFKVKYDLTQVIPCQGFEDQLPTPVSMALEPIFHQNSAHLSSPSRHPRSFLTLGIGVGNSLTIIFYTFHCHLWHTPYTPITGCCYQLKHRSAWDLGLSGLLQIIGHHDESTVVAELVDEGTLKSAAERSCGWSKDIGTV